MRLAWIVLFSTLTTACNEGPAKPSNGVQQSGISAVRSDVKDVVATVSGAPIGAEDIRHQAARTPAADGVRHSPEERAAILNELLTEEVLFQEAIQAGIFHDSKVRKIMVNLLLRQKVYDSVKKDDFTEEELRTYYNEHKNEFVVPEKAQVYRILLKVTPDRSEADTKALAEKLYREIKKDPRVFGDLAGKHSDGPYKRRGGDLGFLAREGKPGVGVEVVEKAFSMQINEVSPPFLAAGAYQILLLRNRRDRVERTFDQMKGSVLRMVKQKKFEQLREGFIEDAKKNYKIEINKEMLDKLELGHRSAPTKRSEHPGH